MIQDIPLDHIDPTPHKHYTQAKIDTVVQIIEREGLKPIIVRSTQDRYTIINGNARYYAVKQLGRQTITATIQEQTPHEILVAEIAQTLQEPEMRIISRVVRFLGVEQSQRLLQQTLDVEAKGGMMTDDGTKRRTPGGVFFKLTKVHIFATDKTLFKRIFGVFQKKHQKPTPAPSPKKKKAPALKPLPWSEAEKYANALLKHEKGTVRTVEIKLIGRPNKVAKAQSCMVAMMENTSTPKSLPKGLPKPPEQSQSFAVFISNKHWAKVSEELKTNPNAELLVKGHPVFNPEKRMMMLLAQSTEIIERRTHVVRERKKPKKETS